MAAVHNVTKAWHADLKQCNITALMAASSIHHHHHHLRLNCGFPVKPELTISAFLLHPFRKTTNSIRFCQKQKDQKLPLTYIAVKCMTSQ